MPGAKSIAEGQYYIGRGNRFWRVMAHILGLDASQAYESRIQRLTESGVTLWDVLESCERVGNLDSKIDFKSERPNDLAQVLVRHPQIRLVAFNGKKASQSFERSIDLPEELHEARTFMTLPSTSGANAAMSLPPLVEAWFAISEFLQ
jgi:double-stranded uracil-DNA glycosylase